MQSKTSFCNGTIIRKNLTRFAPLWISYLLCLLVGLFMLYTDGSMSPEYAGNSWRSFWYANRLIRVLTVLVIVNVGYAFLAVQLLFGDLYSSRICNMLHALPLRRENWFVSNFLSGLLFNLIPLTVFTLAALALTMGSIVVNAWQIPLLIFAAGNLQFITFFGIAVFCAMAVGKRFTMAAAYGLVNLGAIIAHWAITCVYTPMLYGVRLMEQWALALTPAYYMGQSYRFMELESASRLRLRFGEDLVNAAAHFTLGEGWGNLLLWAAVGILLAVAALFMYRQRHLERAGDAVAFPFLKPVFLVLCAVFVSTVAYGAPRAMIGDQIPTYLLLGLGLAAGWFIAKMLVEHTTQVFRLRNWYGLAVLAVVMALTLAGTHFDVLNIVERKPEVEDIVSVKIGNYVNDNEYAFTDPEDIETILRLHDLALADRPEGGTYVYQDGGYVLFNEYPTITPEMEGTGPTDYKETANLCIRYQLKSGLEMVRQYTIWSEEESGDIYKSLTSRWEYLNNHRGETMTPDGELVDALEFALENFRSLNIDFGEPRQEWNLTRQDAEELVEAVKRDCAEGSMSRWGSFHNGYFQWPDVYNDRGYTRRSCIYVSIEGRIGSDHRYSSVWQTQVYPDSRHALSWLEAHGMLENVEIFQGKQPLW